MPEMTSRERILRAFEHREADRIPLVDYPWGTTLERWRREGLPPEADFVDYFGLDRMAEIWVDNSPRYPAGIVEEGEDYRIETNSFGTKIWNQKHATSTPRFLDHTIKDRPSWELAKARISPTPDRIDWAHLQHAYPQWQQSGAWIEAVLWFGFDVTHSWIAGTERVLFALAEDPEWLMDIFGHLLEVNLALLDQVWEAGYRFDGVFWYDDMGYKGHQFFSLKMYRNYLKPFHQRAIDWAHAKGIKARLHSCGDINPFVPELVEMGLDALNPLEVKAGMDPLYLKQAYGDRLVLHGGMNAVLYDEPDQFIAEMEAKIPTLKQNGGYIFSSDHSIPDTVSFADFKRIIARAKELGRYG